MALAAIDDDLDIILPESGTLNAMARLKRDEILKQRISKASGIPMGDIRAQDSRWFESKG